MDSLSEIFLLHEKSVFSGDMIFAEFQRIFLKLALSLSLLHILCIIILL